MHRFTLTSLTAVALVAGSALVALPAHAAATVIVAADGKDCTDPTHTATTTHLTIQSGVDAALNGDTIKVCAGTYKENITTDKSLTLLGNMAGTSATGPRSGPETIVEGASGGEVLVLSGDDTTVDGFTIEDALSSSTDAGLHVSGDGDEVSNNIFTDDQIGVTGEGDGLTVEHNSFGVGTVVTTPSNAVLVQTKGQNDVIQNNTGTAWFFDAAFEVDVPDGTTGVQIEHNVVDVSAGGRFAWIGGTSGLELSDNTVTGGSTSLDGLLMGGGNIDYEIQANTFTGFTGARAINFTGGLKFSDADDGGYIMQNAFHGNLEAVEVADNDLTTPLHILANSFVNNGAGVSPTASNNPGVAIWDPEGVTIDASNNYWGCDTGSDTTGCDYYAEGTPGAVTVTPYLKLTGALAASSIPQGTTTSLTATLDTNSNGDSGLAPLIDPLLELHYAFDKGMVSPTDDPFINQGEGTVTGTTAGSGTVTVSVANSSLSLPLTVEKSVTPPPPTLPRLTIHDASTAEGNSGTHALTFTVTLSKKSTKAVSVHFTTVNGSAVAGQDFIAKSGVLTIPQGKTVGYITVQIKGDKVKEPNEFFAVNIFNPTNARIADTTGNGTIRNDDK